MSGGKTLQDENDDDVRNTRKNIKNSFSNYYSAVYDKRDKKKNFVC